VESGAKSEKKKKKKGNNKKKKKENTSHFNKKKKKGNTSRTRVLCAVGVGRVLSCVVKCAFKSDCVCARWAISF